EVAQRLAAGEAFVDQGLRAETADRSVYPDVPPGDRKPEALAPVPLRRKHDADRQRFTLLGIEVHVAGADIERRGGLARPRIRAAGKAEALGPRVELVEVGRADVA